MAGAEPIHRRLLLLCRTGWARGRWQCVLAGLPLGLLALSAVLILLGFEELPGVSRPMLGHLMRLEGYAAFTGFFFMWFLMAGLAFALFTAPWAVWGIFTAIVVFMTWIMWSTKPGVMMVVQYLGMIALTYLGAFIDRDGPASVLRWLPRVAWVSISFLITMMVAQTPQMVDSWDTEQSVMWAALVHFSLLSMMEFSGLYHLRPADIAGFLGRGEHVSVDPIAEAHAERLRSFAEQQRKERGSVP